MVYVLWGNLGLLIIPIITQMSHFEILYYELGGIDLISQTLGHQVEDR